MKFKSLENGELFTFDAYQGTSKESHIFTKGSFLCPETGKEADAICRKYCYFLILGREASVTKVF